MGKKERKNECLASFKVYCIHVFRFFFYLQCLEIYFLTKGEYGSSPVATCLLELEVGAFWSSNATGYGGKKKKKNPMSPAPKRLVTPECLLYLISARPRGMWCWSMWTVSPFSHWTIIRLAAKKMPQSVPASTLASSISKQTSETELPFYSQKLFSLSVSSRCSSPGFLHVIPGLLKTGSAAPRATPNLWMRRQLQSARW